LAKKENRAGVEIPADKVQAAQALAAEMNKRFGVASLLRIGDRPVIQHECIPTDIYELDNHVLNGGIPKGRITEIYGPESSGKTTLCLQAIAAAQRRGGLAAFIDAEHALDPTYAQQLGVDMNNIYLAQPNSAEEALEITESAARSGAFSIIVVDSVAALVPQAELNGDMGDSHMGLQARLMSQACRKLTAVVGKSNTSLIFINQIRMKIGVMFGNPETTTGGQALKFYSSVRLEVRRSTAIKNGEEVMGNETKIKCVKNKLGNPYRDCLINLEFGKGLSAISSLLKAAERVGSIQKSGSWYSFSGERLGQGAEAVLNALTANEDLYKRVYEQTRLKDQEGIAA
jgi:recombination protein RecA